MIRLAITTASPLRQNHAVEHRVLGSSFALLLLCACARGEGTPAPYTTPASAASSDASVTLPTTDASTNAAGSGEVAPADLFSEGALPTCPAASLENLGTCLLAHSICNARISELERDKVPDVALLRAVATGCEDVYLVVKRGSMWRAIKYVLYLQGHGRRNTDLTLRSIRDTRRASGRVTELIYHVVDDITEIHDEQTSDNHNEYDTTISCTWAPDGGEPTCR